MVHASFLGHFKSGDAKSVPQSIPVRHFGAEILARCLRRGVEPFDFEQPT